MTAVVVEIEGFQLRPHTFIVKELAFYDIKQGYHSRWLFLPPFSWQKLSAKKKKSYDWLTGNCHGLHWESGELPYSAFRLVLQSLFASYTYIYIKGLEKVKFLEKLAGRKILDLNDFSCPKIIGGEKCVAVCPDHAFHFKHCALAKAAVYASFIKERNGWECDH